MRRGEEEFDAALFLRTERNKDIIVAQVKHGTASLVIGMFVAGNGSAENHRSSNCGKEIKEIGENRR
jgi:hypothetical protein